MALTNTLTAHRSQPQAPRLFEGETALVIIAVLGVVLSAFTAVVWLVRGRYIGLEGDLLKPTEFNIALGLFMLNTAAILPLAGFSAAGRRRWRWTTAGIVLYNYTLETTQQLRGIDPRFSAQLHTLLESVPNIVFGVANVVVIIMYVILLWRFLRSSKAAGHAYLRLGVHYGLVSAMMAFAAGVWMVALAGRHTGAAGNVMWLHFLGFEGLKTMLLTGWLAERSVEAESVRGRWTHVAGLSWLGANALLAVQTYLGMSALTLTPVMIACIACLGLWGWATLRLRVAPRAVSVSREPLPQG